MLNRIKFWGWQFLSWFKTRGILATDVMKNNKNKRKKSKILAFLSMPGQKRGVSVLIGYVLLVVFAVVIGAIVFVWLRSYVPAEALNCPDGTSVSIQQASFDGTTNPSQLNVTIKNNGRFDIAGFFIHATNNSSQNVATIDLSNYSSVSEDIFGNSIVYEFNGNSVGSDESASSLFNIPSSLGTLYVVSIIPVRFQIEDNKERFVSCGDARVERDVTPI